MQLKPIQFHITNQTAIAYCLGITLSIYPNNNKYDCRMTYLNHRAEIETGFNTQEQAIQHAVFVLLFNALSKQCSHITKQELSYELNYR